MNDLRKDFYKIVQNYKKDAKKFECVNCGCDKNIQFHHIVPLSIGGSNRLTNIVPLCEICHEKIHGTNRINNINLLKAGVEKAKKAGKYKGRKPIDVDMKQFEELYNQWKAGEITAVKMHKTLNLTPPTFYRRVKKYEAERATLEA